MNYRNVIAATVILVSCSVKEDRTACPCRFELDFRQVDTAVVKSVNVLAMSSEGVIFSEHLETDDFSELLIRDVPQGTLWLNVWNAKQESEADFSIPYGCECPDLYMHCSESEIRGETLRETIDLDKNHCVLTVMMEGRSDMPYSLTFQGNVDGYEMDGTPSHGDFLCVAYPVDSTGVQVVLPRQRDDSLLMYVDDEVNRLKIFAIGEYLRTGGYDWQAEDLKDVTVVLDYFITTVKISVEGWDKEYIYNVTL